MVEYVFTLDDLARLRFAISPPWELVTSLRALRQPSSAGLHLEWVRSVRGTLGGLDLRPALALLGRADYTPDFLTPPPESPLASIADGLEQIRGTPVAQVRREVRNVARVSRAPELPGSFSLARPGPPSGPAPQSGRPSSTSNADDTIIGIPFGGPQMVPERVPLQMEKPRPSGAFPVS